LTKNCLPSHFLSIKNEKSVKSELKTKKFHQTAPPKRPARWFLGAQKPFFALLGGQKMGVSP
jgi:hypothetical protein